MFIYFFVKLDLLFIIHIRIWTNFKQAKSADLNFLGEIIAVNTQDPSIYFIIFYIQIFI